MAHTIKVSDGTTTCDFLGSNYKVLAEGWAPKVAKRRPSRAGGQSPYDDVVETIEIQISGSSKSDVMAKLGTLSDLLDQAGKWGKDDAGVTAVYFEYEPDGSALAASVKAVIVDAPPYTDFLTMPRNFGIVYRDGRHYIGDYNNPITLSFTRRGLWLGATEAKAAAASTGNPAIMTVATFTDTPKIPVPYDASIAFDFDMDIETVIYGLFTNAADKLYLKEGEDFTAANSTAVSTSSAGNVHQQTDNAAVKLYDDSFSINSGARLFAIYAVVSANTDSTNTYWSLKPSFGFDYNSGVLRSQVDGRINTYIPTVQDEPEVVKLGLIATNYSPTSFMLTVTPAANGSTTINVDYVCIAAIDESTRMARISPEIGNFAAPAGDEVLIEHRLASKKQPKVSTLNGSVEYSLAGYGGDVMLAASGNSVSALIFGGKSSALSAAGGSYVIGGSGNELNITLTTTRTMGYLTPL